MGQRRQHRIENLIQPFARILTEETQHEVSMPLQQRILAPVATIRPSITKVLRPVEFDDKPGAGAEKIHLHFPGIVEGDGEFGIKPKKALGGRPRFQPPVEKASLALRARLTPSASEGKYRATMTRRAAFHWQSFASCKTKPVDFCRHLTLLIAVFAGLYAGRASAQNQKSSTVPLSADERSQLNQLRILQSKIETDTSSRAPRFLARSAATALRRLEQADNPEALAKWAESGEAVRPQN